MEEDCSPSRLVQRAKLKLGRLRTEFTVAGLAPGLTFRVHTFRRLDGERRHSELDRYPWSAARARARASGGRCTSQPASTSTSDLGSGSRYEWLGLAQKLDVTSLASGQPKYVRTRGSAWRGRGECVLSPESRLESRLCT